MAIILKVNDVDRSSEIDWRSVSKLEVLTKEPDSLDFRVKNFGTKTYRPDIDDVVTLFDGATKIFGGMVVETSEEVDGLALFFTAKCKDFTHLLDRQLVAKTYTNVTANAIVADILSNFVEAGFTDSGVDAPVIVQKIVFNYLPVSQALQKLAESLGNYDWYVDYDKNLFFFQPSNIIAPFSLTDDSANFLWNSLVVDKKITQLRNHVIIRGGEVLGDSVDNIQVADGTQRTFFVGYSLDTFVAQKAPAADPENFATLDVGADGKDDPDNYDALYNPNDGLLIFPGTGKPATNDRVKTSGVPIFPLIAEKQGLNSIESHGRFQHIIIDKTIKSRAAASQRADAELLKYSSVSMTASFETHNSGLRTGQTISVYSVLRGIDQNFVIQRISTRLRTTSALAHQVEALSSFDNVTMIDVLNKMLVKDPAAQVEIGENEVIDRLYSSFEDIAIGEAVVALTSHNPQTEAVSAADAATVQPLDYGIVFVLGPWTPNISYGGADTKRVFVIEGSLLG